MVRAALVIDLETGALSFLTSQRQQLGTVEVQQGPEGRAVCAVLQQVVHWRDPGDQMGGALLLPVAGLNFLRTNCCKPKCMLHV